MISYQSTQSTQTAVAIKALDKIKVSRPKEYNNMILFIEDDGVSTIIDVNQKIIADFIKIAWKSASEAQKEHYMNLAKTLEFEYQKDFALYIYSNRENTQSKESNASYVKSSQNSNSQGKGL